MKTPRNSVEIYDRITAIEAVKGPNSLFKGQLFRHDFVSPAKIIGLPDGSILIKGGKRLHKIFDYPEFDKNPPKSLSNIYIGVRRIDNKAVPFTTDKKITKNSFGMNYKKVYGPFDNYTEAKRFAADKNRQLKVL